MTIEVSKGTKLEINKKPACLRLFVFFEKNMLAAHAAMKANTEIAGKEIGIPPQNFCRITEEYGLISVTWHPDWPLASLAAMPGTKEQ